VSKERPQLSAGGAWDIEATCLASHSLIRKVARFFTAVREPGATEATGAVASSIHPVDLGANGRSIRNSEGYPATCEAKRSCQRQPPRLFPVYLILPGCVYLLAPTTDWIIRSCDEQKFLFLVNKQKVMGCVDRNKDRSSKVQFRFSDGVIRFVLFFVSIK
jgi:hypothetical protein